MRRLVDCGIRTVPKVGPGLLASEESNGIRISLDPLTFNKTQASKVVMYQITELEGTKDYIKAKRVDGSGNPSGAEEVIAKSLSARQPVTETIDTYEIDYTYTDDNNRVAVAVMLGTEVQVCHPRYKVGDNIAVVKIDNPQIVSTKIVDLYEISPARFWCAAPDGFTPPGS